MLMKVTILGPQGSGKSTQARFLAEKLSLPMIDMGELIRNSCSVENASNWEACQSMRRGELVPSGFATNVLRLELSNLKYKNGFVLDGYPRQIVDLQLYDPKPDKVFYLNTPDLLCIERLLRRKRFDDVKENIEKRLAWYHEKTSKVLDSYKESGKLIEVDGSKDAKEVYEQIVKSIV